MSWFLKLHKIFLYLDSPFLSKSKSNLLRSKPFIKRISVKCFVYLYVKKKIPRKIVEKFSRFLFFIYICIYKERYIYLDFIPIPIPNIYIKKVLFNFPSFYDEKDRKSERLRK